jgi:hypothetical protein
MVAPGECHYSVLACWARGPAESSLRSAVGRADIQARSSEAQNTSTHTRTRLRSWFSRPVFAWQSEQVRLHTQIERHGQGVMSCS